MRSANTIISTIRKLSFSTLSFYDRIYLLGFYIATEEGNVRELTLSILGKKITIPAIQFEGSEDSSDIKNKEQKP